VDEFGRGHRRAEGLARVGCDPEVLVLVLGEKARIEVAPDHPVGAVVERPAARSAAADGLDHRLRIGAGLPGEHQRLADRLVRAGDDDLVARLGHLAGPAGPAVGHRRAHHLEQIAVGFEDVLVAADHDRERPVDGALLAAADRRVEHVDARVGEFSGDLLGDGGRDGRVVDQGHPLAQPVDHGVVLVLAAEYHRPDVRRVGETREHDVCTLGDARGRLAVAPAVVDEVRDGFLRAVVPDDVVAGVEQVLRHRQSHDAETDETDRPV